MMKLLQQRAQSAAKEIRDTRNAATGLAGNAVGFAKQHLKDAAAHHSNTMEKIIEGEDAKEVLKDAANKSSNPLMKHGYNLGSEFAHHFVKHFGEDGKNLMKEGAKVHKAGMEVGKAGMEVGEAAGKTAKHLLKGFSKMMQDNLDKMKKKDIDKPVDSKDSKDSKEKIIQKLEGLLKQMFNIEKKVETLKDEKPVRPPPPTRGGKKTRKTRKHKKSSRKTVKKHRTRKSKRNGRKKGKRTTRRR